MTRFTKPPLTPVQQLGLLEERGLMVNDRERAKRLLEVTTLFRLSPYMRPFQYLDDRQYRFKAGVKLAEIVNVYQTARKASPNRAVIQARTAKRC